ncbi:transposase [Microvirgula curvata]
MPKTDLSSLRQRHSYPKSLKARIVAERAQPGASIAVVALPHGINSICCTNGFVSTALALRQARGHSCQSECYQP